MIVKDAGADAEDVWNDHHIFKAALKKLGSCGGIDNGFDLMRRLPDGTLITEFWPMRCINLFAGVGGFIEGARLAGARVVWAAGH